MDDDRSQPNVSVSSTLGFSMRGPIGWGPVYTEYLTPVLHNMGYEPLQSFLTLAATEEGGTFLDVGANQGYFSLLAASNAGGDLGVHAFEPVDYYYSLLVANVAANKLQRIITTHAVALGADRGAQRMYVQGPSSSLISDWRARTSGKQHGGGVRDIDVERLGEMLDPDSGKHPIVIKLDVEGSEFDVIRGGARWFQHPETSCVLLEAAHPDILSSTTEMLTTLSAWGFDCYGVGYVRPADGQARDEPRLIAYEQAVELGRDRWPGEWVCFRRSHADFDMLHDTAMLFPFFTATRLLTGDRIQALTDAIESETRSGTG